MVLTTDIAQGAVVIDRIRLSLSVSLARLTSCPPSNNHELLLIGLGLESAQVPDEVMDARGGINLVKNAKGRRLLVRR